MINIWVVLAILFVHWVADFVFQTHEQSINKSTSWSYLLEHTFLYSIIWFTAIPFIYSINYDLFIKPPIGLFILFAFITFITHTITDFYTSRINKTLWDNKEVHNFFVSIGFDQYLHYIQLLVTYYILFK